VRAAQRFVQELLCTMGLRLGGGIAHRSEARRMR
jgi:hypothetical protein